VAVLAAAGGARGQCTEQWLPGDGIPGVAGQVTALASWDPDAGGPQPRLLVVGGGFTVAGTVLTSAVAAWNGTSWQSLGSPAISAVLAAAVDPSNRLILADNQGGVYRSRNNGAAWDTLANPSTVDGWVSSLLVVSDSEVYAGGSFTQINGVAASRVARWDGASWNPLGAGVDNTVNTLARLGSTVWAGGTFLNAGGAPANRVAAWNGAAWSPAGTGADGAVNALAVFAGLVHMGGNFTTAGGVTVNRVARWTGSAWQALGSGATGGTGVDALALHGGGLVVGGFYAAAGGLATSGLARWDGAAWSVIPTAGSYPRALVDHNGLLIAGGIFSEVAGVPAMNVARWDGAAWSALGTGFNRAVNAMRLFNGQLVAAGEFSGPAPVVAPRVAAWNGSAWQALGTGPGGTVLALEVYGGELIAAGTTSVAGTNYVARWNGSVWQGLGSGLACSGSCSGTQAKAAAVLGGNLFVGGRFNRAGGLVVSNIARWNGAAWSDVGGGTSGFGGDVNALAVYGGSLIAGGVFTTAGGVACNRVARWTGAAWQPLGEGIQSDNLLSNFPVMAMTVFNGELVVAGNFSRAGTVTAANVARWNGSAWQAMGTLPSTPLALAVHKGTLFAGGGIDSSSVGWTRRWNGSSWQSMGTDPNASVRAALSADLDGNGPRPTELFFGGVFTRLNNQVRGFLARWGCNCPADADGNGLVQPVDVAVFINTWATSLQQGTLAGDFDGNGAVQTADVAVFVSTWAAAVSGGC
jgi:hypothetical protein